MMLERYHLGRCAVVLTKWLALPSLSLLAIGACAASSDDGDEPKSDTRVIIPVSDAAGEASIDAGADAEAPFVPCTPDGLCPVPTPLAVGSVVAIRGRSKSDVWASGSGGVLMRWDGQQWTNIESPLHYTLSSIFLTSDEIWGVSGNVVLRRGQDPKSIRLFSDSTFPVALRPFTDIVVLSNGGTYLSMMRSSSDKPYPLEPFPVPLVKLDFDANTLTHTPRPIHDLTKEPVSLGDARAAYLVPEKAVWVVGDRSAVVRYPLLPASDGGAESLGQGVVIPLASQVDLFAAWSQGDDLWTAGAKGTILHFDGTRWHIETTGTTATLRAIFGFAANDIWAAGDDGTLLHFDGNVWSPLGVGSYRGNLEAIWGAAPDDVWIGGERMMLHWGALP